MSDPTVSSISQEGFDEPAYVTDLCPTENPEQDKKGINKTQEKLNTSLHQNYPGNESSKVRKSENKSTKLKKSHVCNICSLQMTTKQALFKHKKRKHKASEIPRNHPIKCIMCKEFSCPTLKELLNHLKVKHLKDIEILTAKFDTLNDFFKWKKDKEKKSNSWFVLHSGLVHSKDAVRRYYYCNRSGVFKSKGLNKRALKWQGSSKLDGNCCAYMTASLCKQTSTVSVEYCLDHVGHKTDVHHLKISKDEKSLSDCKRSKTVRAETGLDDDVSDTTHDLDETFTQTRSEVSNMISDLTVLINNATSIKVLEDMKRHLNAAKVAATRQQAIDTEHSCSTNGTRSSNGKVDQQTKKQRTSKRKKKSSIQTTECKKKAQRKSNIFSEPGEINDDVEEVTLVQCNSCHIWFDISSDIDLDSEFLCANCS